MVTVLEFESTAEKLGKRLFEPPVIAGAMGAGNAGFVVGGGSWSRKVPVPFCKLIPAGGELGSGKPEPVATGWRVGMLDGVCCGGVVCRAIVPNDGLHGAG